MDDFLLTLQQGFYQRGLITGALVGVSCALLGVFLVLRRLSMIGDGLAHMSIGAVGLALAFGWSPLYVSIPLVMASSLLIMHLPEKSSTEGDAAIGLVSATGLAVGVLIVSVSSGSPTSLHSYLFGALMTIGPTEMYCTIALVVIVLLIVSLFYHDLFVATFEPEYARSLGVKVKVMNYILVLGTSLTVVFGMRVVGGLLISSQIVFPAVIALQVARGFKRTLVVAACVAALSVAVGVGLSAFVAAPPGPLIVVTNVVLFIFTYFIRLIRS